MTTLRVMVPDGENLQYLAFWVAKAAGAFAEEHVEVEVVVPSIPKLARATFEREAAAGVLPPPVYLGMIADQVPVVLAANLLRHDPIDLVARPDFARERQLGEDLPLGERLRRARGARIGVAPHPPTRLRALYATQGMDADKDAVLVILHGKEQNAAFHAGEVDLLYCHTPFLERAIVHDGAVMVVRQTRGDVPTLSNRQIHTLAFSRALVEAELDLCVRAVRAIARAEALIHADRAAVVAALRREWPARDVRELETIVELYEPAIPQTPQVRVEDLAPALALFPDGMPRPSLEGIDLAAFVRPDLFERGRPAPAAPAAARSWRTWTPAAAVALALVGGTYWLRTRRRRNEGA